MNDHHRNETSERIEERELQAVAQVLRNLPDPEPPTDLVERVMAEVQRREARPRVLRGRFRRFEPVIAAAMAAGLGALVLTTAIQSGLLPESGVTDETELRPTVARRVEGVVLGDVGPMRAPVGPSLVSAGLLPRRQLPGASPGLHVAPPSLASFRDRRLDHEINRLLLDPPAFYDRLARMDAPDAFVDQLADRAARRGDAAEVALRLRNQAVGHRETSVLVERLLRSALAQASARR